MHNTIKNKKILHNKICYINILILFFLFVFSKNLIALPNAYCNITPEIFISPITPEAQNTSNNLRRKQGGGFVAEGNPIVISGTVTDENCMPITDAIITIWHTNAHGFYQLKENSEELEMDFSKKIIDKNFMGIGQTYSDNLGQYHFLTIFPGTSTEEPPHINVAIHHNDFDILQTKILFPNQINNQIIIEKYKILEEVSSFLIAKKECSSNNGDVYTFNITLPGRNLYKRY